MHLALPATSQNACCENDHDVQLVHSIHITSGGKTTIRRKKMTKSMSLHKEHKLIKY